MEGPKIMTLTPTHSKVDTHSHKQTFKSRQRMSKYKIRRPELREKILTQIDGQSSVEIIGMRSPMICTIIISSIN